GAARAARLRRAGRDRRLVLRRAALLRGREPRRAHPDRAVAAVPAGHAVARPRRLRAARRRSGRSVERGGSGARRGRPRLPRARARGAAVTGADGVPSRPWCPRCPACPAVLLALPPGAAERASLRRPVPPPGAAESIDVPYHFP